MDEELKKVVEQLGRAFEEFKQAHAQQIAEIKSGRGVEATLNDKIEKLSAALTDLQTQKDEIEKKLNRPNLGQQDNIEEQKAVVVFNSEIKAHAAALGLAQPTDISVDQYRAYKSAFNIYARKGDKFLSGEEQKALQVGVDADGGYLCPPDLSGRIVQKLFDLSPIRAIADVQSISGGSLEGIEDTGEADAGWTGETSSRSETNSPQIGKYSIVAEEMYAQPRATQKLLDDAAVDVESWLANKVADKLARTEGAAYVVGNGVAKPRGFTTYTTAATADASRAWGQLEHVNTGANGAFAGSNPGDILFDVEGAFKPGYLAGANWVTRRSVITAVRKFKGSDNNYLWQPGLQAGKPATLIGYPITMAEDMPTLATGSLSMALGNFRLGYQIVDRLGIRLLRDPFTAKPYVVFYTTKRTGGAVVNFEAIKFVRFST